MNCELTTLDTLKKHLLAATMGAEKPTCGAMFVESLTGLTQSIL